MKYPFMILVKHNSGVCEDVYHIGYVAGYMYQLRLCDTYREEILLNENGEWPTGRQSPKIFRTQEAALKFGEKHKRKVIGWRKSIDSIEYHEIVVRKMYHHAYKKYTESEISSFIRKTLKRELIK